MVVNLQILEDKKKQQEARLLVFQQEATGHQTSFNRLALHLKAMVHKPLLTERTVLCERKNRLEAKMAATNDLLPPLKREVELLRIQIIEANTNYINAENKLHASTPFFDDIIKRDVEITNGESQVRVAVNKLEQLQQESERALLHTEKKQKQLEECSATITRIEQWLSTHDQDKDLEKEIPVFRQITKELSVYQQEIKKLQATQSVKMDLEKREKELLVKAREKILELTTGIGLAEEQHQLHTEKLAAILSGRSLEEIEDAYDALPALINLYKERERLSREYEKYGGLEKTARQQLMELQTKHEKEYELLLDLETKKTNAELILPDLQQLVELQARIRNYEEDRIKLEPEKPCPLCGSTHHPYKENKYQSLITTTEQKLLDHKVYLNDTVNRVNQQSIVVHGCLNKLEIINDEISRFQAQRLEIAGLVRDTTDQRLKAFPVEDLVSITQLISDHQAEWETLGTELKTLKALQVKLSNDADKINLQRGDLIRAEAVAPQTVERINYIREEIQRLQQEADAIQQKYATAVDSAVAFANKYHIDFNPDLVEQIEAVLNTRSDHYHIATKKWHEQRIEQSRLISDHQNAINGVNEKSKLLQIQNTVVTNEQLALSELQTQRKLLFGEKNPIDERHKLNEHLQQLKAIVNELQMRFTQQQEALKIKEVELMELGKNLEEINQQYTATSEALTRNLYSDQINSIEELSVCFLPEKEAQVIADLKQSLETNIKTTNDILTSIVTEYNKEIEKKLTSDSQQTLEFLHGEKEQVIRELNQEKGRWQQVLEKDAVDAQKYREVALQAEAQQNEWKRWDKLCALIGSADGKKFSRFAQGLTLARLTDLANRHLKKFSDRYQIMKTSDKDLELQIIDTWQADVVRPMTTLSGGESFLVSLALALGLSDLAGHKVRIHSLFIDEGFGTLDAETLDIAISALESLQATGKMIGIISHVEALKERIGTRIEVSKRPGGYSKLSVKSHGILMMES